MIIKKKHYIARKLLAIYPFFTLFMGFRKKQDVKPITEQNGTLLMSEHTLEENEASRSVQ